MIKLYGYDTINTLKVLIFLFESGIDYEFEPINIRIGEQHTAEFLAINPAGKIPVIWDGDEYQAESNSILFSLAHKTGWGLADNPSLQTKLISWLFYQASNQGPYFGQIEYWSKKAKVPNPEALAQYRAIANRTIVDLNNNLRDKQYICGDVYSIADIAFFPWFRAHKHLGLSIEKAEHLSQWLDRILARLATQKALAVYNQISS
ncbi:MAG: glutathione S-transferase family protein [SAR324 cluster bacterium]|jgi:GSH-dependent disulfide-bond oxidoreductase|nr:glutathione S-transferase family protein [SAR324 cluster bacterium]